MKNSKKILVSLLSMLMLLSIIPSTLVGASDGQLSIKPIQPIEGLREDCIRGVDISSLEKVEFYGGKFFDNGKERDVLDILKDRGINWVRLRLWNDPVLDGGFCDKESVVAMAKRVKAHGFKILLNFHYSDHWADPGQQTKPAKWADLSFEELKQAVYDYTYEVVSELKEAGALPDMIQIGNEIRSGMLWPDGKSWGEGGGEFDRLAELLKCGIKAVHDVAGDESVKIALHLDNGHDNGAYRWWFDEITERDVDFDVIGMSWYPYWHGNLEQLKYNMNDISARYDKEVAVLETAYGFTLRDADGHANIFGSEQRDIAGYPASVQGQADLLYDVFKAVADVPNNRGLGVFYWEPAWLGVEGAGWIEGQGNAWENQAMFDFGGNALDSLYVFGGIVEPVVVGYEAVEVQTDVFVAPELPETITAWYTDGIARNVKVTWEAIDEGAYQNEGSFSVIGTVEGTAKMATANVIVNPIKDTPQEPIEDKAVSTVIDMIDALPTLEDLTLKDKKAVGEARALYESLTDEQKQLVTNLDQLIAAESKIAELEAPEAPETLEEDKITDTTDSKKIDTDSEVDVIAYVDKADKVKTGDSGVNIYIILSVITVNIIICLLVIKKRKSKTI